MKNLSALLVMLALVGCTEPTDPEVPAPDPQEQAEHDAYMQQDGAAHSHDAEGNAPAEAGESAPAETAPAEAAPADAAPAETPAEAAPAEEAPAEEAPSTDN